LGLVYYGAAVGSLRLAVIGENVTPFWPPTGIAVAALVVFGLRLWPGVAIAAFLVNIPIDASLADAALTAFGNTLAPLVAATLLVRTGFRTELDRTRDAGWLVLVPCRR
jgi:integral membrane sensor domain MASE1